MIEEDNVRGLIIEESRVKNDINNNNNNVSNDDSKRIKKIKLRNNRKIN